MFKRILSFAALAALITTPLVANAATVTEHALQTPERIMCRFTVTTSSIAAAAIDTTVSMKVKNGWQFISNTTTASARVVCPIVFMFDSATANLDTAQVAVDLSMDGTNWAQATDGALETLIEGTTVLTKVIEGPAKYFRLRVKNLDETTGVINVRGAYLYNK